MLPGDFFRLRRLALRAALLRWRHFFPWNSSSHANPRMSVERLADCEPQIARNIRELAFEAIVRFGRCGR